MKLNTKIEHDFEDKIDYEDEIEGNRTKLKSNQNCKTRNRTSLMKLNELKSKSTELLEIEIGHVINETNVFDCS